MSKKSEKIQALRDAIFTADAIAAANVLEAIGNGVPFSLSCGECDAGQGIASYADAVAAGWTEICVDEDGLGWNFLGTCPECRREIGRGLFA